MDNQDWYSCAYNRKPINYYSDLMKDFDQIVQSRVGFSKMYDILFSKEWRSFCIDYGSSSDMFRCFQKMTDRWYLPNYGKLFLRTCGHDLANWVIHEGSLKSLSLILHVAQRSKFNLWKKFKDVDAILPYDPVTECMYYCKWKNVDVLLSHGYNLEHIDFLHVKLVEKVFSEIAASSENRNYLMEVNFNSYRRRCFLICMVIRIYLAKNDFSYRGCDAALKSIWKHLPDSYLTKDDFLSILDPFPAKLSLLAEMHDRYISTVCDGDYSLVQKPRTLAHYSRCRVRQMMCKNFSLPNGVHELPISAELQNYLLYK